MPVHGGFLHHFAGAAQLLFPVFFNPLHYSAAQVPTGIIHQTDFDTYTNDWLEVVSTKADELEKCFRLAGAGENIHCVYFSALQIAQLVSTVGAQNIRGRFLIIRDDANYPHFALALFATDDLNGRLSAYYVSHNYWALASGSPADLNVFAPVLLPDALASYWQQNWSPEGEDPVATPAMFNSTYGYLRGYTFALDDFLKPLAYIPAGTSMQQAAPIRINFGLHTYYPATSNGEELRSTFGLMVSYVCPPKPGADDIEDTEVFYDLANPCPPKC